MKIVYNRRIRYILITSFLTALICQTVFSSPKEGGDIVSWCIADVTGDGEEEITILTGDGEVDGLRYGGTMKIYPLDSLVGFTSRSAETSRNTEDPVIKGGAEPILDMDLSVLRPIMVQAGDIDGDGQTEIALCVYKTAEFHPVMAKRPFFYRYSDGDIEPVWLGSRLSRPFDDYTLMDVNDDGRHEIVSIERLENGERVVCAYYWKGFGFELLLESEPFECEPVFVFDADTEGRAWESDCIILRCPNGGYKLWPNAEMTGFVVTRGLEIH